ncbi:uncharacterized mitochondrial protein AtMg00310-like [Arachis hypogaea]|uniref:uncharacterized mitochondrial protein AtMg00310-like n=1 Tax=Arachis hypogaea TaxID=3818 RepID=UPI003B20EEA0
MRVNIEEILGMPTWEEPGKYLGLPAQWKKSKNKALTWIEEKVMNKLEGWKEKLLNQTGKEILIKSVIQAIPAYVMNVVMLPKNFCQRICARIAKFWWASSGKDKGVHWRSWTKISVSKEEGGLGFRDMQSQNLAYLAKQAWRVTRNPNAIWVKILKGIYFPETYFWEAKEGKGAS